MTGLFLLLVLLVTPAWGERVRDCGAFPCCTWDEKAKGDSQEWHEYSQEWSNIPSCSDARHRACLVRPFPGFGRVTTTTTPPSVLSCNGPITCETDRCKCWGSAPSRIMMCTIGDAVGGTALGDCPTELLAAARLVLPLLSLSTDITTHDLSYRTPAAQLREEAAAIERRDAAVTRLRKAVEACGREEKP